MTSRSNVVGPLRVVLAVVLLLWPLAAQAQQGGARRIGFLGNSTEALEANLIGPFQEGPRAHGWVEGRDLLIRYRWAAGDYTRLPDLVAELLAERVEVLVTAGTPAATSPG